MPEIDPLLARLDFARSHLRARYDGADHLGDPDLIAAEREILSKIMDTIDDVSERLQFDRP
jgi:hypothetical protein